MSEAVNGDPHIDEKFMLDLVNLSKHIELFTDGCLSTPDGEGKNVIHNLGQKESRDGLVAVDVMIGDLFTLRARLFQRNDICNEQGRGALSARINKLRDSVAGAVQVGGG